jgi:quercetin dioxygenase-like cupin family protein
MTEKKSDGERGGALGQKASLGSMIAYQAGSVVSRSIINRKEGTITLFAFDEDQGLSEHTSPYDALLQVLDGVALVTVAGNVSEMKAGEAVILPAGKPHSLKAKSKFKMLLVMIR